MFPKKLTLILLAITPFISVTMQKSVEARLAVAHSKVARLTKELSERTANVDKLKCDCTEAADKLRLDKSKENLRELDSIVAQCMQVKRSIAGTKFELLAAQESLSNIKDTLVGIEFSRLCRAGEVFSE